MKFRTEINIAPFDSKINHKNKIVTFGSCFADNIAEKLSYYKFNVLQNPFGVLYNPVSIANILGFVYSDKKFDKEDLIFYNGQFHSFYHHGKFSNNDENRCLENINNSIQETSEFIKDAKWAIITYGTSFVYEHINRKIIVSNCHKIPQNEFKRFRLSIEETTKNIVRAIKYLKMLNEKIKTVLTVSPIRHWKDGAIENQRSKATLLLAVEKAISSCDDIYYFPSYELMMDDLRDYRFYEENLLHPNKTAINYIWEKFSETLFDEKTKEILRRIEKIIKSLNHKPRNPYSDEHILFIENLNKQIKDLRKEFPGIKF